MMTSRHFWFGLAAGYLVAAFFPLSLSGRGTWRGAVSPESDRPPGMTGGTPGGGPGT
jgi:hypothetical protein